MNIKALSIVLVGGALALSSCSGGGSSTADNLKDAAPGDSLLYYFGQIQAAEYWRQAESDTTLRDEKSREDFMRGVKAGMDAVRSEDAYNQGVYLGVQMAMQIKESEEAYGIKCNKGVLLDAIKGGLANDSAVNIGEANMAFRGIIDNLEARKEAADKEAARSALAKEGQALKMKMIDKDLYAAAPTKAGSGPMLKTGDHVAVTAIFSHLDGKEIDRQAPQDLPVGEMLPGPITEALLTMNTGETREFLTTASALYGRYYQRYGMKADDIIRILLSTSPAAPKPEAPAPAAESGVID